MRYLLKITEEEALGEGKFINSQGKTECVEFVRQATGAPPTYLWRKGIRVLDAHLGQIPRGTAIATFDADGKYPTDAHGKHAAVYLGHTPQGIVVLDQWNDQGEVKQRQILFNRPNGTRRSNDGNTFYVIE